MEQYCNQYVDKDALLYLILASEVLHALHPNVITIAKDTTLYPGLCEPTSQGGLGFDYFVSRPAPDVIIIPSEWSMSKIIGTLMGNKTMLIRCFCIQKIITSPYLEFAEFGKHLDSCSNKEERLLRGSSLHKMIRLLTFTIGVAYLNFAGNEFGHLKRVEFPMSSNNFSYSLASRCWDLLSREALHRQFFCFDKDKKERNSFEGSGGLPNNIHHVNDSTMVKSEILRGPILFVFDFHPTNSYERYSIDDEKQDNIKSC